MRNCEGDGAAGLPAPTEAQRTRLTVQARTWIRSGLAGGDGQHRMLRDAAEIGAEPIAQAADQALRLSHLPEAATQHAEALFDRLSKIGGDKRPRGWLDRWRHLPERAEPDWPALLEEMVTAGDELLRRHSLLDRFNADLMRVEARLVETGQLITELAKAVAGAARELGEEGEWMSRDLAPRLASRAEDLLAQLVITRQNQAAVGMMQANGAMLLDAVERARGTMVSAFATAATAARAVAEQTLLHERVEALRTAVDGGATQAGTARAAFDDALRDMRRSLDAAAEGRLA